MNNSQMHTQLDVLLDKAGSPWFSASEKDVFLNLALLEYVKETYRDFENTEKKKEDLSPLARRIMVKPASSAKTISLNVMPDFLFILNMLGVYTDTCKGKTITLTNYKHLETGVANYVYSGNYHPLLETSTTTQTEVAETNSYLQAIQVNVKPVQLDDINMTMNDPFNKPTNDYPLYVVRGDVESNGYIELYCDDNPLAVYIDYLKTPKSIDGENKPLEDIDLPSHTHDEIVNIALRKMLDNVENINRYKVQQLEINEQNN